MIHVFNCVFKVTQTLINRNLTVFLATHFSVHPASGHCLGSHCRLNKPLQHILLTVSNSVSPDL